LAIANSAGFSDYTDGLKPDYNLKESVSQLGVLGSPGEPLFSTTINLINGNGRLFLIQDNLIENRIVDPEMENEQRLFLEIPDFKIIEK